MILGQGPPARAALPPQATTPQAPTVPMVPDPAHLLELQTRVAVLEAQHNVLTERTQANDPTVRAQAEHSLLTVDLDLATAKAQLAVLQGTSGTEMPPPRANPPFGIDPDAITAVFLLTAFAILIPLSVGLTRRFWRGKPARSAASATEDKILPRLDRLEQAVDSIAIEIERVSESQRFVAKVLTERPSPSAPPRAPAVDAAAVGEGKPFLALGAGPLEPVRVPERQAVKQSITPH